MPGRTAQFGSQALLQVIFGLAGLKAFGLLVGYALGYVLRFVLFLLVLPAADRRQLASCRVRRFWPLACEHWRHAVLGTPARLLQNAVQLLPAILLAALYDPAIAGLFALAQRILVMPVRLLSHAASQVFLGEAVTRDPRRSDACSAAPRSASSCSAASAWRRSCSPGRRSSPSCSGSPGGSPESWRKRSW